jgi:hypothetical protein
VIGLLPRPPFAAVRPIGLLIHLAFSLCLLVPPAILRGQARVDSTTYPPRGAYQHPLTISAPYDGTYDKTVLQTAPFPVTPTLALSVLTAIDGRHVTKPPSSIVVTFWSSAPAGFYATSHSVRVVLNAIDSLELGNAWLSPQHDPAYTEVLLKGLSVGQLLAIANASRVSIRLGPTEFVLSNSQMQGMRDLASRMAPEAP